MSYNILKIMLSVTVKVKYSAVDINSPDSDSSRWIVVEVV